MGDKDADAIYDEIKIYQGALTTAEILNDYITNSPKGNIFKIKFLKLNNLKLNIKFKKK